MLGHAYDVMVERLLAERHDSARRAIAAQEAERGVSAASCTTRSARR